MSLEEKVSLTISIAKSYRDRLRTMAAKRNLHDLDQLTSASTIAREIICDQIDELEGVEADFMLADKLSNRGVESDPVEPSQVNAFKTNGETVQ